MNQPEEEEFQEEEEKIIQIIPAWGWKAIYGDKEPYYLPIACWMLKEITWSFPDGHVEINRIIIGAVCNSFGFVAADATGELVGYLGPDQNINDKYLWVRP